jgi:hypothetical protein
MIFAHFEVHRIAKPSTLRVRTMVFTTQKQQGYKIRPSLGILSNYATMFRKLDLVSEVGFFYGTPWSKFWGYVAVCVQLYCRWFTVLRLAVAVLHYMFRPTWPSSCVYDVLLLYSWRNLLRCFLLPFLARGYTNPKTQKFFNNTVQQDAKI